MTDNTISFRADMIDLILSGKKTVTIRPMKPQPKPGSGSLPECPYMIDDIVAVQEKPEVQLWITGVTAAWLSDLKTMYICREGICPKINLNCEVKSCPITFSNRIRFWKLWDEIYGETEYKKGNNPAVWVFTFKKLPGSP